MTSLVILPPENEDLNFDEILQQHLSGDKIGSPQALLNLQGLCSSSEHTRDELIKRIKAKYTIHALNSPTLKDIMKVDLGGIKVQDLGLKTFFIYYETFIYHEDMSKAPNLRDFLINIDWTNAKDHATKQAVINFFGINSPGPIESITMQQIGHRVQAECYRIKGEGWEFQILFNLYWHKINKIPTLGAGFQGDLGRLAFFQ